ncbi:HupE/UreJ family protein [Polaribacter septentrionalilitoris]|uniref:HupE/UreJ family protein n=1 Tax=Polaribacter septentrionalilitoris TaxID=2494657 RepID=UPI00135CDAC0|nr:HupE/UreJ family protein [Polaribacter septentrionalilitoris]
MKIGGKHVLKFSIYNYIIFLFLVIFFIKSNQLKRIFSLGLFFSIGFFIALFLSAYFSLKANLGVVKFVIPLLIFSLSFLSIQKEKLVKKFFQTFTMGLILLFGFFNGLGVFTNFINEVSIHTSLLLPIFLTLIGALVSVLSLAFVFFGIKILLNNIKNIPKFNWSYGLSVVGFCVSLFMMISKIFI